MRRGAHRRAPAPEAARRAAREPRPTHRARRTAPHPPAARRAVRRRSRSQRRPESWLRSPSAGSRSRRDRPTVARTPATRGTRGGSTASPPRAAASGSRSFPPRQRPGPSPRSESGSGQAREQVVDATAAQTRDHDVGAAPADAHRLEARRRIERGEPLAAQRPRRALAADEERRATDFDAVDQILAPGTRPRSRRRLRPARSGCRAREDRRGRSAA